MRFMLTIIISLIAFSSSLSSLSYAQQAEITSVRYWTSPTNIRVVVDLTNEVSYQVKESLLPPEILITIENTRSNNQDLLANNAAIRQISISQKDKNVSCVKIELTKKTTFNVFQLKKYQSKPDRLVIDINIPDVKKILPISQKEIELIKKRSKIVVIDAGHGGEDPGAIGPGGLQEKDVVLNIAKKLAGYFNQRHDVKAFLTRDGDYFIPLGERIKLCKHYDGDIFISIHANASPKENVRGSSVYVLSTEGADNKAAQLVAQRENMADLIGGIAKIENDVVASILVDLSQTQAINESLVLAKVTLDSMVSSCHTLSLGIGRAGFAVLKSIDVPSILVETAFISNIEEEKLLATDEFQELMSRAIYEATLKYLGVSSSVVSLVPPKGYKYHVVKKGETLWSIAALYDKSPQEIKGLNADIPPSDVVFVGQELIIP
ncbi:MAG: N-acetylmuramoyl-L-alanine amidase [bacterium]|nr:N-acetylmuramoyl-L-alanine amidase [bacterium]